MLELLGINNYPILFYAPKTASPTTHSITINTNSLTPKIPKVEKESNKTKRLTGHHNVNSRSSCKLKEMGAKNSLFIQRICYVKETLSGKVVEN